LGLGIISPWTGQVHQRLADANEVRDWRYNWLWRSPHDGMTAAERLGLATGQVREDHILGYDVRVAVERLWAEAAEAEASNGDGYTAVPAINRLS
jgi:hypothetical protein